MILIPSSFSAEESQHIAQAIVDGTKGIDDYILVLRNNLDRYQLLCGETLSTAQIQRKIDKLRDLYSNSVKSFKQSGLKRFKSD